MKSRPFAVLLAIIVFMGNLSGVSAKDVREIALKADKGKPGEYVEVQVTMKDTKYVAGIQCTIGYDTTKLEIENKDIEVGEALENFMYEKNVIKEKSYLKFSAISNEGIHKGEENVLFSLKFKIKEGAVKGKTPITVDYLLVTDAMNQDIQCRTKNTEIHVKKEVVKGPNKKEGQDQDEDQNKDNDGEDRLNSQIEVTRSEVTKIITALLKQIDY